MEIKAHMICHTHWDREWYFTREQFRTKLIRLIDGLLELIDTVPEYVSFMLDGQTIILEDYLAIKPYNRERLYQALRCGKIVCGPWYILPDELLVSGESHIRNYLIGSKVSESAGVQKMKTAYLPDSFGHPSQMPQIVSGLGMDAMVFWRGVSAAVDQTEFYWESPCKEKKVFCVHLANGYGNCANLDADMDVTVSRVESQIRELGARSSTDVILLMNGSDHIIGQKNITEIVKGLTQRLPQYDIKLSTMEAFLKDLRSDLPELKTYTGEFRSSERSMLLGGTLSSRMELKQRNDAVQKRMERYLEPMLAGERLLGGKEDIRGYSDYLWKKILEDHPHDSICGCSIDEVHREMMTRFDCVDQLEERLLADAALRIEKLAGKKEGETAVYLNLFEPSQDGCPSYLEVDLDLDKCLVQEVNFARSIINDYEPELRHPDCPKGLEIRDEQGREIPFLLLESGKGYVTRYQDHTAPEIYKSNHMRVGLMLPGFSYGFHELCVRRKESAAMKLEAGETPWIENEYYRLTVEDGAFTVEDKVRGRVHKGVGRLMDKGDAGDEYTYSWPAEDTVCTLEPESVRVHSQKLGNFGQRLLLEGSLYLPRALREDRKSRDTQLVECPVRMEVTLLRGIDRIDFHTEVENRACDHRLQVRFPSGVRTEYSEASEAFTVTRRPVEVPVPAEWMEYPQTTFPVHGFMNLEDGHGGVSVAGSGLTEGEAVQEETETSLYLTLLRCVGWLSRTDLLTRVGNGGWTIETPDAQCQGLYRFDYSIAYHGGNWREEGLFGRMEKFRMPCMLRQLEGNAPTNISGCNPLEWVAALPQNVRLSALKSAEDDSGLILRAYEVEGLETKMELPFPKGVSSACLTNLAEETLTQLEAQNGKIQISLQPHEIVTLKFI